MMWTPLTNAGREERLLELLLRIGVAGCFIGHGAFGVIGKEAWLSYFAVAGIGPDWAWRLMPVVGTVDIAVGILALLAPRPVFLGYAAVWSVWTALLRPLAGESFFETLERAGNYGVPIAFLMLAGVGLRPTWRWLQSVEIRRMAAVERRDIMFALRATTATLLLGHGGLALQGKPLLVTHAASVGVPPDALPLLGGFEVLLAIAVAVRPVAPLLLFVLAWKLGTEALFPFTGDPIWEFIERAGSYIAPLALWTMVRARSPKVQPVNVVASVGVAVLISSGALLAAATGSGPEASGLVSLRTVSVAPASPRPARGVRAGRAAGEGSAHSVVLTSTPSGVQEIDLLARLQVGGLVLACRHAITDRSRGDARSVDFDDWTTQRILSAEGEEQARRLGSIIRRKQIPVGEVYASPYQRTSESARLAFGTVELRSELYGGNESKRQAVRDWLTTPPSDGGNRVLMTHQGTLYRSLPEMERGSIREGDCVVVRPRGDTYSILARLGPDELEALR
ncbi:MAG: histidine phosphatase family protein [Gemmatimonadota bacterium]